MKRASKAQGLFRKQAVNAAGYRWFSPVLIVTPPSALPSCIIALLAVACLIVAMVVIEIPERIRATGVLLPRQGLLKVRARRSGWIEELSIANGAMVTRGQALMWLTDAQRAPERQPEAVERLVSLRHELQLLDQSVDQELAAMESRQGLSQRRKKLIERRLLVAESEHETRQHQAALQRSRSNRVAELAVDGLVAAQSADELAASALQARALGEFAWQQVLALQDELAGTENRIATERRRYNQAVRNYNVVVRRFPSNIIAGIAGFEKSDAYFEAAAGAEQVPVVEF